jgi:hypothetical protein
MTMMVEAINAILVVKPIYHIQHSTHILKQNTIFTYQVQGKAEVGQRKT